MKWKHTQADDTVSKYEKFINPLRKLLNDKVYIEIIEV